jgi:hypothetical protein
MSLHVELKNGMELLPVGSDNVCYLLVGFSARHLADTESSVFIKDRS